MQKHQRLDDMMNIHIITVDVDPYETTAIKYMPPCSCDLYVPRGGTIYIYILYKAGTFSQVPRGRLSWPPTPWDPVAPCSN